MKAGPLGPIVNLRLVMGFRPNTENNNGGTLLFSVFDTGCVTLGSGRPTSTGRLPHLASLKKSPSSSSSSSWGVGSRGVFEYYVILYQHIYI